MTTKTVGELARERWEAAYERNEPPEGTRVHYIAATELALVLTELGVFPSLSVARRQISGGCVQVDKGQVMSPTLVLPLGRHVVRIGSKHRKFVVLEVMDVVE